MRDLLSKLDAIVSETELKNPEDLQAKRNALADLEKDPVASGDPEISSAITQRKSDLEKEAKSKGFAESFQIGDEFGISFSEDHEIATTIVDMLEDGIVIELDDLALEMLTNEGLNFLEGELSEGVAGAQKCWKGFRKVGTKAGTGANAGKRVNDCEKIGEDLDESGLQRYTGIKKYGKDGFEALQKAGREGADEEEKGRIKDKYLKKEDHGPENPDAAVNYGEYDREGDMAKDDLRTIDDAVEELYSILQADDNLPEWVQAKITKAVDYIDTARDYMKAQNYEEGVAEDDMEEGWDDIKKFGKKAAVAGAIGLGALGSAQAQDAPSGEDMLPSIVAHVTFKVDGNTISKDINLGTTFKSPGQAGDALAKFLKSKGIKYYNYSLERVKANEPLVTPDEMRASNQEYDRRQNTGNLDTTPLTDKGDSKAGRMEPDKGYTSPSRGGQAKDYMSKEDMDEAKYQGREVPLGKKMAGDVKKSKVYVRKPNGNIVKVNFGDKKMRIKKSNPARRKSFRARHNCANPGPRHKARYWSCRSW
jgi:hypothetical protein